MGPFSYRDCILSTFSFGVNVRYVRPCEEIASDQCDAGRLSIEPVGPLLGQVEPDAQRLEFDGVVASADCSIGALSMVSEAAPSDGNRYAVDVAAATLRNMSGSAIACGDLSNGDVLNVQGEIRDDGGIDCHEADRRRGDGSGPGR